MKFNTKMEHGSDTMNNNFRIFIFGVIIGIFLLGFAAWFNYDGFEIVSNKPIQPEITISIVDGVADTTYTYKEVIND